MRGRAAIAMAGVLLVSTSALADEQKAAPRWPARRVARWVMLSVGGALLTAAVPTEIVVSNSGGGSPFCYPHCQSDIAVAFEVGSAVAIGVGASLMLSALIWRAVDTQSTIPRVSFVPLLAPHLGGASLHVSF